MEREGREREKGGVSMKVKREKDIKKKRRTFKKQEI